MNPRWFKAGLEKPGFKKKPAQWVFLFFWGFFGFFGVFWGFLVFFWIFFIYLPRKESF
jgi:hypothetical protein